MTSNEYAAALRERLELSEKMWDDCFQRSDGRYTVAEFVSCLDLQLRMLKEIYEVEKAVESALWVF